jgi:Bacterial PH domain
MNHERRGQERFRRSLWPIVVGWLIAAYAAWHGAMDLQTLLSGDYPLRGFLFGFLSTMPRPVQTAFALAQCALLALALPSLISFAMRRIVLTVGETGVTLQSWRGWRRIAWADIARLDFILGEAIFSVREGGALKRIRFSPWTIGLDADGFRALIERHQPRLTPDEDEGQPWARSSEFRS